MQGTTARQHARRHHAARMFAPRIIAAGVAASFVVVAFLPAIASAAPLPRTVLKVKSIDWQPRTGVVEVTARVKCTGQGRHSWQVSLEQNRARDRGSAKVPCDGDAFLSTIVLQAKHGRFHPGSAVFAKGSITCGSDACIGYQVATPIRISPPSKVHAR